MTTSTDALIASAEALAEALEAPFDGRDGRDGKDGRDGRDADPDVMRSMIAEALADMPKPRDGRDADPAQVREQIRRAFGELVLKDPQIGPVPRHEWDGTKLRFELPGGQWGAWVDLQGPRGARGADGFGGGGMGGPGPQGPQGPAGPAGAVANSYFPTGW